jgi:hypothetical protein
MIYDANVATIDLEIERLRPERRRHGPRNNSNQIPAIKMLIGDWYVDELRIDARNYGTRLTSFGRAHQFASRT